MSTQRRTRCAGIALAGVVALVGACAEPTPTPAGTRTPATTHTSSTQASNTRAANSPAWTDVERGSGARIGVVVLDTGSGATIAHRSDERFPMMSTFKVLVVAALLRAHPLSTGWFEQRVRITAADTVSNSPITGARVGTEMSIAELARAALQHSDNTAGNLLLDRFGGPAALTAWVRTLGDRVTRLDRREPDLNTAIPGDPRDTSTPAAEVSNLRALMLGQPDAPAVLPGPERHQLIDWMIGNTTGASKIRAALPGWTVADTTGSGDHGSADDIAIALPPGGGTPLVLAVMTTRVSGGADADADPALIATVTRAALAGLHHDGG